MAQRLLIEETLPIEHELYLDIALDENAFMTSKAGGMEIEEVARQVPGLHPGPSRQI